MISWPLLGNINFSPQIRVCGQVPMYNYIYNTHKFRYLKIIFNSLKIYLIFAGKLRRELECAKKRKLETSAEQHEAAKKSNTKNEPIVSKTVKAKENSGLILKSMEELTGQKRFKFKETIAPTNNPNYGVLQESKLQNLNSSHDSHLKLLAELNTNRFDNISKNIQEKASNSSNLEVKENDKSGVLYKHKFRENLQVYLDPITKELASKPSKEVMDYLEETPSITLKDWITAGIFFKAKPSLKIRTASAICWNYLGIF